MPREHSPDTPRGSQRESSQTIRSPQRASFRKNTSKKNFNIVRFFLTVNFRKSIPSLAATKRVAEQCLITRENRQNGNEEGSQKGTRKEGSKEDHQEEVNQ
jgi:hypothetical protein